jgi:hypothetical protein
MTDLDRVPAEHPLPHEHARRRRQHLLAEIASANRAGRFRLRRRGVRPYRRWVVPAIAAVGLGIAGMGTAAGLTDWWTEADPPVRPGEVAAAIDRANAVTHTGAIDIAGENARTVARAPGAAIVAAPASEGYCFVRVPDRSEARLSCFAGDLGAGLHLLSWIQREGDRAWYLYGRMLEEEGAARLELFEQVTRPLDEDGPERLPDTPLAAELGPGGFFLFRVPEELWASLDLAYAQVSVLDEDGTVIERMCRYLGASPLSPLAGAYLLGGGPGGVLDRGSHDAYPCPATGSYLDDATLRLAPPRSAEIGPFTGRDVVSGERIALSRFSARPLVLAVARPLTETGMRFLRELSTFARRHPETSVVVVVEDSPRTFEDEGVSLVDAVTSLETPISVLTGDFPWPLDRHLVVAVDPNGRVRAELRPPRNDLYMFEVVTQDLLDELLSKATSG